MTITLMFLAVLMGAIIWWLFRQTVGVEPWAAGAGVRDAHAAVLARPTAKLALWMFLAVATSLFALFISAYAMRLNFLDWRPLPQPRLLMVNTAILIVASLAMEWTAFAARRGDVDRVRKGLVASGLLTVGFIAGQLVVWQQLAAAGYFMTTSAATAFFYLLTAVHGVHVLGGMVAWARSAGRAWGKASMASMADMARLRMGVELCAMYWHFLLAVWVVLFAVLVSKELGLAICSPAIPM